MSREGTRKEREEERQRKEVRRGEKENITRSSQREAKRCMYNYIPTNEEEKSIYN